MRYILFTFLVLIVFVFTNFAQTRQSAIDEFNGLQEKGELLEKEILSVTTEDINTASAQGLNVFRLLPRETYDKNIFKVRGGGAYYSFTKKSHSYNETPQIALEQDSLSVGFAGADYGFLADLGKFKIDLIEQTAEAKYLLKYTPPKLESEIRLEQSAKENSIESGRLSGRKTYASVGNTYLLRAISFDEADTLVSFKIHRQDADGSLIIFWKPIKDFEIPIMLRQADEEMKSKVLSAMAKKGFNKVRVEVKNDVVTLTGTVPKGKIGEAVMTTNELTPKKIENQLTQQK